MEILNTIILWSVCFLVGYADGVCAVYYFTNSYLVVV